MAVGLELAAAVGAGNGLIVNSLLTVGTGGHHCFSFLLRKFPNLIFASFNDLMAGWQHLIKGCL